MKTMIILDPSRPNANEPNRVDAFGRVCDSRRSLRIRVKSRLKRTWGAEYDDATSVRLASVIEPIRFARRAESEAFRSLSSSRIAASEFVFPRAPVAQGIEQRISNPPVAGSNPAGRTSVQIIPRHPTFSQMPCFRLPNWRRINANHARSGASFSPLKPKIRRQRAPTSGK